MARPGFDRPLLAQGIRPGLLRGGGDRLLPLADHDHDVAGADPLPGGHPAGGALGGRARPLPACRPDDAVDADVRRRGDRLPDPDGPRRRAVPLQRPHRQGRLRLRSRL